MREEFWSDFTVMPRRNWKYHKLALLMLFLGFFIVAVGSSIAILGGWWLLLGIPTVIGGITITLTALTHLY